ncbi:MAG: hypothetical protein JSU74_00755 [Candidatus Zixiibacteriota bacterium]|nr:MAG: hypothetical protein JSU74_00755 [candidate division Zixibacteria bacterium]
MNLNKSISCSLILCYLLAGCGGGFRETGTRVKDESLEKQEVNVEAYLFDAKLRRRKKPTSVRLEFYHTDSVIAIAGRGYLGKGALRGRLTADSIEVYFPTTDEYLLESVARVLGSVECSGPLPPLSLLALFANLPDSVLREPGLSIESDHSDKRHPRYRISMNGCPWEIDLTYAWQDLGWRVKKFSFDDGAELTLKATRRTYKRSAKVKAGKFKIPVKLGSVRITL